MQTKEKEKERKKPFKSGNVLSYLHWSLKINEDKVRLISLQLL